MFIERLRHFNIFIKNEWKQTKWLSLGNSNPTILWLVTIVVGSFTFNFFLFELFNSVYGNLSAFY